MCDFNDKLFQASHSPDLLAKDKRLEELDKNTREWRQKWGGAGRNQLQRQQSVLRKYYPSQRLHSGARRNLTKQINCVNHHQHITGRKFQWIHKRKKIPTDAFSRIMGATETLSSKVTRKCRLLAAETLLVDGERLAFTNGEHNCPLVQIGI